MKKEKFNKKLLVEGKNDLHVVSALCQAHNVKENFDIIETNGVDEIIQEVKLRFSNPSNISALGILIDADYDDNTKAEKIKSLLNKYGFDIQEPLPSNGLIISGDKLYPPVGVWVMPDNQSYGMLEDFVSLLAPIDDPLMKEAKDVVKKLEDRRLGRWKSNHKSKAQIHSFLAWVDEPGTPMGQAITKRILNPEMESAVVFVDWLRRLFC